MKYLANIIHTRNHTILSHITILLHNVDMGLPSVQCCVARWPSGWDAGLAINRVWVQILSSLLSSATLGKLTHVPLHHQAV